MKLFGCQLLLNFHCAMGADLGVVAKTFVIKEQSFAMMMQERLMAIPASTMDEHKRKIIAKTKARINRPKGANLPRAEFNRRFVFDSSITIKKDIMHEGKILMPKGTNANPLDFVALSKPLIFFDGDDAAQLAWSKLQKGLLILTNGAPLELSRLWGRVVYFDQHQALTKKIGIQAVPARVFQVGRELIVEEIVL